MSSKGTNKVTLVGHSLGGALSLIESAYIKLNVPTAIIKVVAYGMPRVNTFSASFRLLRSYAAFFRSVTKPSLTGLTHT